jgi:hypothetical protein
MGMLDLRMTYTMDLSHLATRMAISVEATSTSLLNWEAPLKKLLHRF